MSLVKVMASPVAAGLLALIVYIVRGMFSRDGLNTTAVPYFSYLADAFLHGQLYLRLMPPSHHDLVLYQGNTYLYWMPFPAVLVAPLVAVFGVSVSDVVYTAVLSAINAGVLAHLLANLDKEGIIPLDRARRSLLGLTVAFGSVLMILSPVGQVWFTAQIVGWLLVLLAAAAAVGRRGRLGYFLVGLCLACAAATRPQMLFNGIFIVWLLLARHRATTWRWRLSALLMLAAPIGAMAGMILAYNYARFGSALEMGLAWHYMGDVFLPEYQVYGAFNLHYLPTNLYYQFVYHPIVNVQNWQWGGSLFLMTPLFFGALKAIWQKRTHPFVWSLVLSCVVIYIPIGLVMGTGLITFGPRYLLDLMLPIILLTAMGIRSWPLSRVSLLTTLSVLTYVWGSVLWLRANWAGIL